MRFLPFFLAFLAVFPCVSGRFPCALCRFSLRLLPSAQALGGKAPRPREYGTRAPGTRRLRSSRPKGVLMGQFPRSKRAGPQLRRGALRRGLLRAGAFRDARPPAPLGPSGAFGPVHLRAAPGTPALRGRRPRGEWTAP